jgi:septal ring factor EnvC (AmiA/AmiB activator)
MNRCILPIVVAAVALGGCSTNSPRSAGEMISTRGATITQFGDSWTVGASEVKKGGRLIEASDKQLTKAQKDLANARSALSSAEQRIRAAESDKIAAQQMVADGNLRMQRAEADYADVRAGPSANPDTPRM